MLYVIKLRHRPKSKGAIKTDFTVRICTVRILHTCCTCLIYVSVRDVERELGGGGQPCLLAFQPRAVIKRTEKRLQYTSSGKFLAGAGYGCVISLEYLYMHCLSL